jgi:hypothetical protein
MSKSSLRRCSICEKSGNNTKGIYTVRKDFTINKINAFFGHKKRILPREDICITCIHVADDNWKKKVNQPESDINLNEQFNTNDTDFHVTTDENNNECKK